MNAAGTLGLSYEQTRSSRFLRPSRGVRVDVRRAGEDSTSLDAALVGSVDSAVVTDIDAARLWGLPLPPWMQDSPGRVSLAVAPDAAHPRRRGVRGRRLILPDGHVVEHDGRQVTTPVRTWLDCAAEVPFEYVVAMGDAGLASRLMSRDDLRAVLHWGYRRRGVAIARRAFPMLDSAAASPGESVTRVHLLAEGLPPPVCNHNVVIDGEWFARVDLAWPDFRVAVEYDGLVHLEESQRRYDARRRNLLQEHGWLVITATADDLRRPWILGQQTRAALLSRGWRAARPR